MNVPDPLAVLLCLVLLVAPAWLWTLALWPRREGGMDGLERGVVAGGLGLAGIPAAAFVWREVLGIPLGTLGSWALLVILAGSGAALAWRRARGQVVPA